MTPLQRNNLIGTVLVAIALLQFIPILPMAIDFLAMRIRQDFQEQQK